MPQFDELTALIVVDVQNDFADSEGSLSVPGGEDIIQLINATVTAAHAAGAVVAYTQDWHPPVTPHFQKDGGPWPVHCVAGTWGAEFHPDLAVDGPVIRKGTGGEDGYSGFSTRDPVTGSQTETSLDQLLSGRSVTKLVVVGLATDYCVKETVLDGLRLGYAVTVLSDQIRAVDLAEGDGRAALAAMTARGAVVV